MTTVKRSAAKRKPATDAVSSVPFISDFEYSDRFPAIPVVFLSASDVEVSGHAVACNKNGMVRITSPDGESDVPLARVVSWHGFRVGDRVHSEFIQGEIEAFGPDALLKLDNGNTIAISYQALSHYTLAQSDSRKFLLEIDGLGTLSQKFTANDFQPLDNGLEVENRVSILKADIAALIGKIATIQEVIELGDEPEPKESSELSKVEPIDELTEITAQVDGLYSQANEAEQVCIDAGKSALILTFELGAKLQQAKELVKHGNWLPWLTERGISEDKAKRAIRLHKHRGDLEAVMESGSLPDLTPSRALALISAKRDEEAPNSKPEPEPEEKYSFEEVSELFKPWGELSHNPANRKLPYTFDRPGHSAGFRNLKEAVAYHLRSCREDNKLEAKQGQEPSDLGTVPFHPAPPTAQTGDRADENGQLENSATDESSDRLEGSVPEDRQLPENSEQLLGDLVVNRVPLQRVENDFYPTHSLLTKELLKVVDIQGQVLEPCAGDGAIANLFNGFIANEPNPHSSFVPDYQLDATCRESWEAFEADGGCDWVVTNPPFNVAPEILPLAFEHARVGVAFLLRLSYMEPCGDRANWLKANADHLCHQIILNPRPRFRSDTNGGDNVTAVWLVWRKDFSWSKLGVESPFIFANEWREPVLLSSLGE